MLKFSQELNKNTNHHLYSDLWMGTVTSCDPATHIVLVAPDGEMNHNVLQAIPLASTVCSALGFNETVLPTVGTRVLCCGRSGKKCILIGSLPTIDEQPDSSSSCLSNKAILAVKDPIFDNVHRNGYSDDINKAIMVNSLLPTDTVQGEKVIGNEFGVMLGLFKLMATLKASELSQVQCHFLDDLVRIVSHNFQHYSSLGELKIYHDGKGINLEVGATHSPKESLGESSNPAIERIQTENDPDAQFFKLENEQSVMIERMKLFAGKLGDFVNFMLVRPSDENRSLGSDFEGKPSTGLLQIKASLDGSLVVRSVKGVHIEKTNWIRVPERTRAAEDPQGDDGANVEYTVREEYEFDDSYTYRDVAFLYYLQLRDYLSYINEDVGYSHFKSHPKDFYVNDDQSAETQLEDITYVDQETGARYKKTKSWVSLMNNGGVSLSDAWGSCIAMEGGNIYIQPAKDLVLQPNRNLIGKVGGNIGLAARREIDISSTEGGLRAKTHNSQHYYSSDSGIILQADGPAFNTGVIPYPDTNMPVNVSGILLHAAQGSITNYASEIRNQSTEVYSIISKSIVSNSTSETLLSSDSDFIVSGSFVGLVAENEIINYSEGSNVVLGLEQTIVGKKGQYFGEVEVFGAAIPVNGLLDPNNNDQKSFFENLHDIYTRTTAFDPLDYVLSFNEPDTLEGVTFEFPPSLIYQLDDNEVLPQTLSQQSDSHHQLYNLKPWVEEPAGTTYPYPGAEKSDTLALVQLNNVAKDINLINKATELVKKGTITLGNVFTDYKSI